MQSRPDDDAASDRESAYDLLQRGQALLDRRHYAQAAIVPAELAEAVEDAGGPDAATDLLRATKADKQP